MEALFAQLETFQQLLQGGVSMVLLVGLVILGRYHLHREKEHKQELAEINTSCKACREGWQQREKEWNSCKADLEKEYRTKIESLLREQIRWQDDMLDAADPDDE